MFIAVFFVLSILICLIEIFVFHVTILPAFISGLLAGSIGLQGIYTFLGHYFKSDEIAKDIGWPIGNPFQKEIAFGNLSFGTAGVLCLWMDDGFQLATILISAIFLWGAAFIHIKDIRENNNQNVFNAGPMLYYDIIIPALLIILFFTNKLFFTAAAA